MTHPLEYYAYIKHGEYRVVIEEIDHEDWECILDQIFAEQEGIV